jgi:hypothetical protein
LACTLASKPSEAQAVKKTARTSQHGRGTLSKILFIVHLSLRRPIESIDSTELPVSMVAASSSLKLIGPTAPMKINALRTVIVNVFMVVFLCLITPIGIVS